MQKITQGLMLLIGCLLFGSAIALTPDEERRQVKERQAREREVAQENARAERIRQEEQAARQKAERVRRQIERDRIAREQAARQKIVDEQAAEAARQQAVRDQAVAQQARERAAQAQRASSIAMVRLPAGSFVMGCQSGRDTACDGHESPAHTVSISAFELGKTEVTVGQFRAFVEATNYQTTAEKQGSCWIWTGSTWEDGKGNSWRKTGFSQTDNDPVVCVSWEDGQAMIAWLNQTAGRGYRLPSESEWEYACRAGGSHNYCGGDNVDAVAWHNSNGGNKTHPVGGKQANAWGLYDMSGNVWEWVQDWHHSGYNGAPSDGSAWEDSGTYRVLRGGSWSDFPHISRAAIRSGNTPAERSYMGIGFRLARTLP